VSTVAGNDKIRYFADEEKALAWLASRT
jgi:hypothetical protein